MNKKYFALGFVFALSAASAWAAPHGSGQPPAAPRREPPKESARELRVKILDNLAKIEKLAMSKEIDAAELKKLSDDLEKVLKGEVSDACPAPKKRDQKAKEALQKELLATIKASFSYETEALEKSLALEPKVGDVEIYRLALAKTKNGYSYTIDAVEAAVKLSAAPNVEGRLPFVTYAFETISPSFSYSTDAMAKAIELTGKLPREVSLESFKERFSIYRKGSSYANDAFEKTVNSFLEKK